MNIGRLILREIGHRKLNFLLGVLAVMLAVGSFVAAEATLKADALETQRLLTLKETELNDKLQEKRAAVSETGAALEDAIRKQMLELGFNVLILPANQNLSELHLTGGLSETMPEAYVDKLANSRIVTVNHLLPSVTRRIDWFEQNREVILVGTRGEVPIMHRGLKKPLLKAVEPGKIVVGYDLHTDLGLSVGDTVTLRGQEFEVSTLHPQRGSEDDVTLWINLEQAQKMLGLENLIHAILALECECAGDRISVIREEIQAILPGTQVIERYSTAVTRAEARAKAKQTAEESLATETAAAEELLAAEKVGRQQVQNRRAALAAFIVPLLLAGSVALIALLAYTNARQRQPEIGILRAIGLTSRQIMVAMLGKAVLIGMIGGILGCLLGMVVAVGLDGNASGVPLSIITSLPMLNTLLLAPVLATFLAALASWLPALLASRQDPALVLQGE